MYKTNKYTVRQSADTETFTCAVCGRTVTSAGAGSLHRNHCPYCLSSVHLDDQPGDRAAECGGIMEIVGVWVRKSGEGAIIPLASPPFPLSSLEKRGEKEETDT